MAMSKAAFKTIREQLGITPEFLASRAGVHKNVIWRIESHAKPAQVSEAAERALLNLRAEFDMAVEVEVVASNASGVTPRYPTQAALAQRHRGLAEWPDRVRSALAAEVNLRTGNPIEYTEE